MKRGTPWVVLVAVLVLAGVGVVRWASPQKMNHRARAPVSSVVDGELPSLPLPDPPSAPVAAPTAAPDGTRLDRIARDRMRALIVRAFAQPPATEAPPPSGGRRYELRSAPPPPPPGDPGRLEPSYVRERMHADFFPMALGCYTEAEKRMPGLTGSIVVRFTVIGDSHVGGVVDSADVMDRSTIRDQDMIDCIRESMLSMTFLPPEHGGFVTVEYPIDFDPDEEG